MKQILCVIDFTESSGRVLDLAAIIAHACRAHLIVLFPYRLIDYSHRGDMSSLKLKLESEAREKFFNLKKNLPHKEYLTCEFQAEIGFVADRISAHAKKNNIEMVIIGQQQTESGN